MPPKPVFLFVFANDAAQSLRLDDEWRAAERALQAAEDAGSIRFNLTPSTKKEDLWDKFNRFAQQIAVFHYGGHSNGAGIDLVDTELKGKNLATLLGLERNLKLVFLNGCANADQVKVLFERGVPLVIATSVPVADERAAQLARAFYTALTAGRTIAEAFEVAAAFVNDRQKQPLLKYRDASFDEFEDEDTFPWGLYVNKEQALHWTIPNKPPHSVTRNRRRIAPWIGGVITLIAAAIGYYLMVMLVTPEEPAFSKVPHDTTLDTSTLIAPVDAHSLTQEEKPLQKDPVNIEVNDQGKIGNVITGDSNTIEINQDF
jgi:hypothetical protein